MKNLSFVLLILLFAQGVYGQSLLDSLSSDFDFKISGVQYRIDYDSINKIPKTVVYYIDYRELGSYGRLDFHDEKYMNTGDKSYYYDSGYDKGHMMSSKSSISETANYESFDWVNITPQWYSFNRGIWKKSENFERWNSDTCTYIICGPIINSDTCRLGDILVAHTFYKILYRTQDSVSIGLILNKDDSGNLWDYAVSVDSIERLIDKTFKFPIDKTKFDINRWDWE